jgi:hypothetical protein
MPLTCGWPMEIERAKGLVDEALALDFEDAKKAGALGFFARMLVQVTMPHSKPDSNEFERRNGPLVLSMMAPSKVGLPYGTYPRLLMAWITTEAVRTKSRELELGHSLTEFLGRLGLTSAGGPRGPITVLRQQMLRLFSSSVSWTWTNDRRDLGVSFHPIEKRSLWWDPKTPGQVAFFQSTLSLNETFFREIIDRPVPVNVVALKVLGRERSPMALDIYNWLTYRMSYLEKDQHIPWRLLQLQFGADYGRVRDFKLKFLERLKLVQAVYRGVKVTPDEKGLILSPSPSHIPYKAVRGDNPFPPGV